MSKGYKVNIKNLHYAILIKDDETGVEYGPIKRLPRLMEVTVTPNILEGELYEEGKLADKEVQLSNLVVSMNLSKLSLAERAEWQGYEYEGGVVEEGVDNKAPYIALAWEVETNGKSSEFIWLYKGKLTPPTDELKQREGNITYNTNNTNLTFIPRDYDGKIRKLADGNDESIDQTVITNWFKQVPGTVAA